LPIYNLGINVKRTYQANFINGVYWSKLTLSLHRALMTKNTAERIEVLNVISARRRPKNNEEFWPAWAGGSAEMAPPCIPPGPIYIRLCNGLKLCLGFQQVNLGSHLHQDCAKSMSENHFKVGKFGVSLAYYYDHSFTFRFYRINC